jgi:ketosteroid isomerase-like protein
MSANDSDRAKVEVLEQIFDAFNRHDVEGVLRHMTDDCVFETAAGPSHMEAGYRGRHGSVRPSHRYGPASPRTVARYAAFRRRRSSCLRVDFCGRACG